MSDCARNLSSRAEGRGRMQEAFWVSTGPLYEQSVSSKESCEGSLCPCAEKRSRPFPPLWSRAGAPDSNASGCWGSGQLWATVHPAAQCSKCCTLALSKEYLKADNPPANHQKYLFFPPSYLQVRYTRLVNTRVFCKECIQGCHSPAAEKWDMLYALNAKALLVPIIVS